MEVLEEFLKTSNGNGNGYGYGYGYGSGDVYGTGDGYCYGTGYGDGYGSGYGSGDGSGSGNGRGNGRGNGSGFGDGNGRGNGSGDGSGRGNGSGDGSGDDYGIGSINGMHVYNIDGVPTVISHVKGNIAKGWILKSDLTLNPCYIAKQDNLFAHGETLREAMEALEEKLFNNMPEEERMEAFLDAVQDGPEYPARLFFDWHGRLTGSCQMGRETFVKNHSIDLDKDTMTLRRFLELTREDYGGEIIRKVEEALREEEG